MALENERKFLLADSRWRQSVQRRERMVQGYLAHNRRCSVRVRLHGSHACLNIKEARLGVSREEYEYVIPQDEGRRLLRLCGPARVEKTRHYLVYAGKTWEIDEFEGDNQGLVVAEIELAQADEPFDAPPWLGAEVSMEARYYNSHLARHPYREW